MDDPINPGTFLLYADNHYQDLMWNTGISNNDNISIEGGSEKQKILQLLFGYGNQAGGFVGTQYKRYDVLGNFGFKASEKFRVDANQLPEPPADLCRPFRMNWLEAFALRRFTVFLRMMEILAYKAIRSPQQVAYGAIR